MRLAFCLFAILLSSSILHAQKKYRAVSVYSVLADDADNFKLFSRIGASSGPGIDLNGSFIAGVEHTWGLDTWIYLNTGIEYSHRSIAATIYKSMGADEKATGTLEMIAVPVYFRFNLGKYIFFTSGAVLDFEVKNNVITNQTGVAATGGFGIMYPFKHQPLTIILHPHYQLHNVFPLFHESGGDRMINYSAKLGLIYRFK